MPAGKTGPAKTRDAIWLGEAAPSDLNDINNLIAAAIATWHLAERVKRISLPLYRYHENDLKEMQIIVAHSGEDDILGVAAVEPAYASDVFGGLPTSLLHGIYVAPNLHRRGVGTRLIEKIENLAHSRGARVLLVKARPEAISFFKARGFGQLTTRDRRGDYPYQFFKIL
jgi:GNAT superfamily N-acetyltransferase